MKLSNNQKLVLDLSKIYSWIGIFMGFWVMVGDIEQFWFSIGMMTKFGLIVGYLNGNNKLRSWAILLSGITFLIALFGFIAEPDAWGLGDIIGCSMILYYSLKIAK